MYKLHKNLKSIKNQLNNVRILSNTKNVTDLDAGYVPHKVEGVGGAENYFAPPLNGKKFTLILPPPNITGTLHLGHALTATIQDVLVKWYRMNGYQTVWVPGMDHAGIATQIVVEKKLWKEMGKTRHDLGRENFQNLILEWKNEKKNVIEKQLRRLNVALNWDKEVFTMDKQRSEAVIEAFIRLFDAGLIYRADHLVNWSCVLQSAISDIEVEHLTIDKTTEISVPGYEKPVKFGQLCNFSYKVFDEDEEIIVSTTRPETMLGDVAVAVNPNDNRYTHLIGKKLWHPFRQETIPVIADDFVDVDFGTGAVKITPAHDQNDFEAGKRHNLKTINVIDENGRLSNECGEFAGIQRFDARDVIIGRLSQLNLFKGTRDHQMTLPICSRSKDVVELMAREQWFVKCKEMAEGAVRDVKEGRLTIEPPQFEKTWFNWLENIRDWCISRQLWWGHRIPAFKCTKDGETLWVAAKNVQEAQKKASDKFGVPQDLIEVRQDEDVLDTWFSSSLLPFSAFGWPNQDEQIGKYYPLDLMETGHDIIFFWVARMVMLGTHLTGRLPFNKILLHGIICDAHGRKMSKSLGNVIAPENVIGGITLKELESVARNGHESGLLSVDELNKTIQGQKKMFPEGIAECGADALRYTLCSHNIKNHFINFDVAECYNNKLFGNKIWQATKFTRLWYDKVSKVQNLDTNFEDLCLMDKWILSRLDKLVSCANEHFPLYNFHIITSTLKEFLYYDFCDVYLESTKRGLRSPETPRASGHVWTLITSLDTGLRTIAPFMPSIAQHLHQRLPVLNLKLDYPQPLSWRNEDLEKEVATILDVVVAIRRLKKIFNIVAKHKPTVHISSNNNVYEKFSETIQDLAQCHQLHLHSKEEVFDHKNLILDKVGDVTLHLLIPEELKKTIEMDLPNMARKKEKLQKELEKMQKMVSGSTYHQNATPEAQESHSKKISGLQDKICRINYMESLCL